jgi:hypothetical protein
MTYPRILPDTDSLVIGILAAALGAAARVVPEVEADMTDHLAEGTGYVVVESRGGGERHPQFAGLSVVDISCWTADSRRGCADLAEACRVGLWTAVRSQTVRSDGHLSTYRRLSGPIRIPSGVDAVWRLLSTYELGTRPPAAAP